MRPRPERLSSVSRLFSTPVRNFCLSNNVFAWLNIQIAARRYPACLILCFQPCIFIQGISVITSLLHSSFSPNLSLSQFLHPRFLLSFLSILLSVSLSCFPFHSSSFSSISFVSLRRARRRKIARHIPRQQFQGSVTSLTNWLPHGASLPRSCCSSRISTLPSLDAFSSRKTRRSDESRSWPGGIERSVETPFCADRLTVPRLSRLLQLIFRAPRMDTGWFGITGQSNEVRDDQRNGYIFIQYEWF